MRVALCCALAIRCFQPTLPWVDPYLSPGGDRARGKAGAVEMNAIEGEQEPSTKGKGCWRPGGWTERRGCRVASTSRIAPGERDLPLPPSGSRDLSADCSAASSVTCLVVPPQFTLLHTSSSRFCFRLPHPFSERSGVIGRKRAEVTVGQSYKNLD